MRKTQALLLATVSAVLLSACAGNRPLAQDPASDPTEAASESKLAKNQRSRALRLYLTATQAKLNGEPMQAIHGFNEVLKVDPRNAASMFELGKLYHATQQGNEALAMARKAVATDRSNIWYRFLLADLCSQLGDLPGATKVYREIVADWPDRHEIYFRLAEVLNAQGRTKETTQVFRDLEARIGPDQELAMREFEMHAAAGRLQEAKTVLQRAVQQYPEEARFWAMLAQVYDELGDPKKALELYEKALALQPDDSMTRIALAQYYYDNNRQEDAFLQLREAFADPDLEVDPKMHLLLGLFQMSSMPDHGGEQLVQESLRLIEVLKKAHPQSGKPHSIEGDFHLREERYTEARDAFRKALEYETDKFPIWSALLQLDMELQDFKALHSDAEQALELFPTQPVFYLFNGVALDQLKRHDEAIDALITGRDLVVDDRELVNQFWSALGNSYHAAGKHQESDAAYEKALLADSNDLLVLNNYAYFLSERGERLEKAESMSRKVNELAPGQATYMDTYAWVLYKMGRYADARSWQEKAIAAAGESVDGTLLEHYGDILYRSGEKEAALEQWKKAKATGDASDLIDRKVGEGRLVE